MYPTGGQQVSETKFQSVTFDMDHLMTKKNGPNFLPIMIGVDPFNYEKVSWTKFQPVLFDMAPFGDQRLSELSFN